MKHFLVLFCLFIGLNANSQAIYKTSGGDVSFFSETPMENIDAHNKSASSFIKTASKEVVFVVPIRSFKFRKALMEEHFNEKYMESEKYPDATFQGKINEDVDFTKDGEYKVTATGKMKVHGTEKTITTPGTLTIKNGTINLKSAFDITLRDYNIDIPRLVVQNIAEVVAVKLDLNYVPYKK